MLKKVIVPDIGAYTNVDVIEVLVSVGQMIEKEASMITLETEKATMEIPSPFKGKIVELAVKLGDKISAGDLILTMEVAEEGAAQKEEKVSASSSDKQTPVPQTPVQQNIDASQSKTAIADSKEQDKKAQDKKAEKKSDLASATAKPDLPSTAPGTTLVSASAVHAGPAVRRFARELGVDLQNLSGTGPRNRILFSDVQNYVKTQLQFLKSTPQAGAFNQNQMQGLGFNLPPWPVVDYEKFGPITREPLSRINKLSAGFLHRNWVMVPHVTQFDEADITQLEIFRKDAAQLAPQGIKFTLVVFIMKALVAALQAYPRFNASLEPNASELILKNYFHIAVAVDTPQGLMVPVIRDVHTKGLFQLAQELTEISERARKGQLTATDMQGSSITITSLGGIGGQFFTPIINVPDVAILGVSKAQTKPVYIDQEWKPRLLLPLSLSYDHRVIDGAYAARFIVFLVQQLSDIRRLLL